MLHLATKGSAAALRKRTRTAPNLKRTLASTMKTMQKAYIYNVSPLAHPECRKAIPGCKPGEEFSEPIIIEPLVFGEYDLGDGAGGMGTTVDPAFDGLDEEGNRVFGVAEDLIGSSHGNRELSLQTTNLEWKGVFASRNSPPTREEINQARLKWQAYCELLYTDGAQKVQAGEKVQASDRALYNLAATVLSRPQLWGSLDHTMDRCPECKEPVVAGANFCKHCQQAIDPASVAARAKKREREAAKLLKEEEEQKETA